MLPPLFRHGRRAQALPLDRSGLASQAFRRRGRGGALGRGVGARRRLPLGCVAPARRDLRRGYAAAHGVGLAARRAHPLLYAHRRARATPAHARQEHLLSDGLGRQWPAHRAARAEPLPRALRSAPALRPRARARARDGQTRQGAAASGLARELHRALPSRDGGGREGLRAAVAPHRPFRGLDAGLRHDRRSLPSHRPALVPRSLAQGARLQRRRAHHVGHRLPDGGGPGRDGRSPAARRLPSHRVRRRRQRRHVRDRDHAPRAARRVRGRHRAPRRRSLQAPVRPHAP